MGVFSSWTLIHFSVRQGDQADATMILVAWGVDLEGTKEVLALRACAEEGKEGWVSVLEDLRARGAIEIDLLVTDGHEGLQALFSATPRQRCLLHKQRNVLNASPRRVRKAGRDRTAGHLGSAHQRGRIDAVGRLHSYIWPTLSRGGEEPGRGRGVHPHLLPVSADNAPLYSDHPCHRESVQHYWAADRPDRRVHHGDELPDHRLGNERGETASKNPAVKRGTPHRTNMNNQPERVVKREVEFWRLTRPAFHHAKGKQTLLRTKTSRAEGKWKHGEERAII